MTENVQHSVACECLKRALSSSGESWVKPNRPELLELLLSVCGGVVLAGGGEGWSLATQPQLL